MARARKTKAAACPVESYARAVVSGEIVAGRLVRLACERHLRDLADGAARGLCWDEGARDRVLAFFANINLAPGKPFKLEPFQQFVVGSLFGWKGPDGFRRFRTAYVEIGKGSGKSPLAAGIGIYGTIADDEDAAEVYAAATKRDQAMILFRDAVRIVDNTPVLSKLLKKSGTFPAVWNLACESKASFFRPISSDDGQSGPRPHVGLIDELHEHKTSLVVNMMRAGVKARRQALIFEITNSGYDRTTICWSHHEYSVQVLEGIVENDSWFAYVCQLDPCEACRAEGKTTPTDGCEKCDDWKDEKVWLKANPGLDTILPRKYLREQVAEAEGMPAQRNIVLRLNFCIWTEAAVHAVPMDKWDAGARKIDLAELRNSQVFAGLDIGSTGDWTALVRLFPHDDAEEVSLPPDPESPDEKQIILRRSYTLVPTFWLPEKPVHRPPQVQQVIDGWVRKGLVRTTPGEVVDYDMVLRDILEMSKEMPFTKIGFDRGFQGAWMGTQLLSHFGAYVVNIFPQGIISMNAPFREFIELLKMGRLFHDGNPIMRWMCSNCAAEERGGLIKPSKDHSSEKIDGVTAAVMGLGVAMSEVIRRPYYEDNDLETMQ